MQVVGEVLEKLIIEKRDVWENLTEGIYITSPEGYDKFQRTQITNDAIDLRISDKGYTMNTKYRFINTLSESSFDDHFDEITLPIEGFVLQPGEILYIGTLERISLKGSYIARISGRSTFARLGLSISSSQDKFCGHNEAIVCLQLRNNSKQGLKIYPFQKLAQILFYKTEGAPDTKDSSYANESEYTLPQITEKDRYQYSEYTANRIAKYPSVKSNLASRGLAKLKNTPNGIKLLNVTMGAIGTFGTAMVSFFTISSTYKFAICAIIFIMYLMVSIIVNLFVDNDI